MDFTIGKYCEIIAAFKEGGWQGCGFDELCEDRVGEKFVVLRHDVDLRPRMSLAVARKEHEMGMRASYYFRAVPESWDEGIIREIAAMGHEVGYHYESMTTCDGDVDLAWDDFRRNLERLRCLAMVKTICMHGSPRSKYDSKELWRKYDYRSLGVIGEPYLDTDWSKMFYLTDTGRRWDGYKVSVRDKIPVWQDVWNKQGLVFHGSDEVIARVRQTTTAIRSEEPGARNSDRSEVMMPERVMMTTHPQRWYDNNAGWLKELVMQNVKNVVKRMLAR